MDFRPYSIDESARRAARNLTGRCLHHSILAVLCDFEAAHPKHFLYSAEAGYMTFAACIDGDASSSAGKRPMTVTSKAKDLLVAFFEALFAHVGAMGGVAGALPNRAKKALIGAETPFSAPVRAMVFAAEGLWAALHDDEKCLSSDGESVSGFEALLARLALERAIPLGANVRELARVYVRFLKCVAKASCNMAFDHRVTLNDWFLRGVLRNFGDLLHLPIDEALLRAMQRAPPPAPSKAPSPTPSKAPPPAPSKAPPLLPSRPSRPLEPVLSVAPEDAPPKRHPSSRRGPVRGMRPFPGGKGGAPGPDDDLGVDDFVIIGNHDGH
jgi:hypothetical protein